MRFWLVLALTLFIPFAAFAGNANPTLDDALAMCRSAGAFAARHEHIHDTVTQDCHTILRQWHQSAEGKAEDAAWALRTKPAPASPVTPATAIHNFLTAKPLLVAPPAPPASK